MVLKGRCLDCDSRYCRWEFFCCSIVFESNCFALSSSVRRAEPRPRPARFMKYVSIRMPEPGPFGETLFEAKALAIVLALLANNPGGGWVESVFTFATHRVLLTVIRPQTHASTGQG
jgi:hypothetical protein